MSAFSRPSIRRPNAQPDGRGWSRDAEVIGPHGGASIGGKLLGPAERVRERNLRAFARRTRPSVAVSHNSYSQAVAGRSLRLPVMTAMDYEYQPANHLAFRCADLVAAPEAFSLDRLLAQGARPGRIWRYPGLKEHIALAGFTPDLGYLGRAGIDASRPVIVVRPPADMALYHRFVNPLFPGLLERLASAPVTTILLARTGAQAADLEAAGFGALLWRGEALDGRQLVAGADAVVSAGGSMNREAAVLGTPAWSIYAGKLAAVDRALVAAGRLHLLHDVQDLARIPLRKKPAAPPPRISDALVVQFVDRLLAVAGP